MGSEMCIRDRLCTLGILNLTRQSFSPGADLKLASALNDCVGSPLIGKSLDLTFFMKPCAVEKTLLPVSLDNVLSLLPDWLVDTVLLPIFLSSTSIKKIPLLVYVFIDKINRVYYNKVCLENKI